MSHPIAHQTYETDILDRWSDDELSRLFELYQNECIQTRTDPSISSFVQWLGENYGQD